MRERMLDAALHPWPTGQDAAHFWDSKILADEERLTLIKHCGECARATTCATLRRIATSTSSIVPRFTRHQRGGCRAG
ncbi:MAG TPA: hypothetical protein VNG69_11645 [Casimicrobiaceae bacterium]|nr:hypothetical protein [Casimicrobiaceae bacterium]